VNQRSHQRGAATCLGSRCASASPPDPPAWRRSSPLPGRARRRRGARVWWIS
jgi:hypothetical protein